MNTASVSTLLTLHVRKADCMKIAERTATWRRNAARRRKLLVSFCDSVVRSQARCCAGASLRKVTPVVRGGLERVLDQVCGEFPGCGEFPVTLSPEACVPGQPAGVGLVETGHVSGVMCRDLGVIIVHATPPRVAGTGARHRS